MLGYEEKLLRVQGHAKEQAVKVEVMEVRAKFAAEDYSKTMHP